MCEALWATALHLFSERREPGSDGRSMSVWLAACHTQRLAELHPQMHPLTLVYLLSTPCSDMTPTNVAALSRSITVLGPAHLARHSVEEAVESAERTAARARVNYAAAPVLERHQLNSQYESQMELEAHYIEVWAGD